MFLIAKMHFLRELSKSAEDDHRDLRASMGHFDTAHDAGTSQPSSMLSLPCGCNPLRIDMGRWFNTPLVVIL